MNRKNLALIALMLVVFSIGAIGFQQARKATTTEATAEFPNDPNAPGAADYYGPQDKRFQDRTCVPEPTLAETFGESMVTKSESKEADAEKETATRELEPKSGRDHDITPLPKEDSGPPEGFDPDKFHEDDQF